VAHRGPHRDVHLWRISAHSSYADESPAFGLPGITAIADWSSQRRAMRQLLPVVRSSTRVERHSRVRSSENPEVELDHEQHELRYRIAWQARVSPMARISLRFVGLFVTRWVAVRRRERGMIWRGACGFSPAAQPRTVRATATRAPSPGYVVDLYVDVIEVRAGQPRRLAPHDRPDGIGDAMKGRSEGHDEPYRQVHAVGQGGVVRLHSG
jgi:hypothetical protein